jgi:eukaryotic-like serine/threonine-protein kinase
MSATINSMFNPDDANSAAPADDELQASTQSPMLPSDPEAVEGSKVLQSLDGFSGEIRHAFAAILGPGHIVDQSITKLDRLSSIPERIGDFIIHREIGRGGMGVVYEAVQESLGRVVALKLLPSRFAVNHRVVQRFQLESRSAARLHHSNIVPVYAVGESNGIHYYSMQCISGCGLNVVVAELRRRTNQVPHSNQQTDNSIPADATNRAVSVISNVFGVDLTANDFNTVFQQPPSTEDIALDSARYHDVHDASDSFSTSSDLAQRGRKRWEAIARIGLQASDALHYASSQGILHRDVKPSNLLLDDSGNIWLTDFGLAKSDSDGDLTEQGDILGTLRYLPPERLDGVTDPRGDLYGLGLTLYELLTLQAAFGCRDRAELMREIANKLPESPRSINPLVPRDLETIVLKLIAKDPKDRYDNGALAAADFQAFLDHRPIKARPIGVLESTMRWCRRNPALATALLSVVFFVLASVAILLKSNDTIKKETLAKSRALVEKNAALEQSQKAFEALQVANELGRRRFYASQMNLANQSFRTGEFTRARELLDGLIPSSGETDLREFAWKHLNFELQSRMICSIDVPAGEIRSMQFSQDANRLLIATGKRGTGVLYEYDASSGACLKEYVQGPDCVQAAYFRNEEQVVAITSDNSVLICDRDNAQLVRKIQLEQSVQCLLLTHDERWLLIGCNGGVVLPITTKDWAVHSPLHLFDSHVTSLFQSLDSTLVYASNRWSEKKEVCVLETATSEVRETSNRIPNEYAMALGGNPLRMAAFNWGDIRLLEPESGKLIQSKMVSDSQLYHGQFSMDGKYLLAAASADRKGLVLSVNDLSIVEFSAHGAAVCSVAMDRDSRRWASGDAAGHVVVFPKPEKEGYRSIAKVEEGSRLCQIGDRFLVSHEKNSISFGNTTQLHPSPESMQGFIRSMSSDGKSVLTSSLSGFVGKPPETLMIWDMDTRQVRISLLIPHEKKTFSPTISSDGELIAYQVANESIQVLAISGETPTKVCELAGLPCLHLRFSPDGKLIAGAGHQGLVGLWDCKTGESLGNVFEFPNEQGWVTKVCFTSDGRYLAGGNSSGEIYVYDLQQKRQVSTLTGHTGEIGALEFFPDNRHLIVGGVGNLRIFDFQTQQEIATLPNDDYKIADICFSENGDTVATLTREGTLRLFQTRRPEMGEPSFSRSTERGRLE